MLPTAGRPACLPISRIGFAFPKLARCLFVSVRAAFAKRHGAIALAACLLSTGATAAWAAEEGDARALHGETTRTLMLEDVPPCEAQASRVGAGAERSLEVGADAVTLRIEFERGTARLGAGATRQLDRLAGMLRDPALAQARFVVAGHTDATGSDAVNVPLSCTRAKAVRTYLQQRHGIDADRLHVEGFGALRPLDPGHPMDAANRRVEVRRLVARKEPP